MSAGVVVVDSAAAGLAAVVALVAREPVVPVLARPVLALLLLVRRPLPAARHPLRERAARLLAQPVPAEPRVRARRPVAAAVSAAVAVELLSLLSRQSS
jgi:hypothetical protein